VGDVRRVLLSWSSGKDSAWTLHVLRQAPDVEVVGLLTTEDEATERVTIHRVRRSLLEAQRVATGLPLIRVTVPDPCPNDVYETRMRAALVEAEALRVDAVAFGDLLLEDIKRYRESRLAPTGLTPLFPLFGSNTALLAREMLDGGLEAVVTTVDLAKLPAPFAGRRWNRALLDALPKGVDPCGENGELHTFCVAGPMFDRRIDVTIGETHEVGGFAYADLDLG
jgi:uncharacterized protein (TIGR00290 family)